MICKNGKDGEFSPVFAVTASLDCGGSFVGSVGLGLCLWAKISTGLWMMHRNIIEKLYLLAAKVVCKKGSGNLQLHSWLLLLLTVKEAALVAACL